MKTKFSTSVRRIFAALADILITYAYLFLILNVIPLDSLSEDKATLIFLFIDLALLIQYFFRDTVYFGRSLGKRMFGLIIVNTDERFYDTDVPFGRRVLRQVVVLGAPGVELIVLLVSGSSLGDKMARTAVIPQKDLDAFVEYKQSLREAKEYEAQHPYRPYYPEEIVKNSPATAENDIPEYFKNTPVDSAGAAESQEAQIPARIPIAPYAPKDKWAINNPYAPPPPPKREIDEELLSDNYAPDYDARNKVDYNAEEEDIKDPYRSPSRNPYAPASADGSEGVSSHPERELSPSALYKKSEESKKATKIILILAGVSIGFFILVFGIVLASLSMVKNSDGYAEAYSYLVSSKTFYRSEATEDDVSLVGYSSHTSYLHADPEEKHVSEYRFSVNGMDLTVVCHKKNGVMYACKDCTDFD